MTEALAAEATTELAEGHRGDTWLPVPGEPRQLRPYQLDAVYEILRTWRRERGVMYCAPVGSGKTDIACGVIRATRGRVLYVAHRAELLRQMRRTMVLHHVDQGRVVLASPLRALRSMAAKGSYDLIVIDEAHRANNPTVRKLLAKHSTTKRLGLSASPFRRNGLRPAFNELVMGPSVEELIAQSVIVAPRCWSIPESDEPDLSDVTITAGDYSVGRLERAVDKPHLCGDIVREWFKHASDRSTLVFATSVRHAGSIVEAFRARGVDARMVHSKTPTKERDDLLQGFDAGRFPVLVNVLLLTEGIDVHRIDCLVLARPTKSIVLYTQATGRAMRPSPTGLTPIILDHAGAVREHGLPTLERPWTLDALPKYSRVGGKELAKRCKVCGTMAHLSAMECAFCGAPFRRVLEDLHLEEVLPAKWHRFEGAPPWFDDLGKIPDEQIERDNGLGRGQARRMRQKLGIPTAERWRRSGIDWGKEKRLGKVPDPVLAKKLGVSVGAVGNARRKRGIPQCDNRGRPLPKKESGIKGIDWNTQPLGKMPDTDLARSLDVDASTVGHARRGRGIPAYKRPRAPVRETQRTPRPACEGCGVTIGRKRGRPKRWCKACWDKPEVRRAFWDSRREEQTMWWENLSNEQRKDHRAKCIARSNPTGRQCAALARRGTKYEGRCKSPPLEDSRLLHQL